jgi:hypothetical protein
MCVNCTHRAQKALTKALRMNQLGRISSDKGAQLVIKQITDRGARAKLKAAMAYDAQQAAEAIKKATEKSAA